LQRTILKLAADLPDHYSEISTALFGIAERIARAETVMELRTLIQEVRASAPSFVTACRDHVPPNNASRNPNRVNAVITPYEAPPDSPTGNYG